MYLKEFSPIAMLKPYIRSYFFMRINNFGRFHFPADGCPGLIMNLGEPFLLGFKPNRLKTIVGCQFFGSQTRNLLTHQNTRHTELIAVKFNPGLWTRFFNVRALELTDNCTSLQHLWGKYGRQVEQRFFETKNVLKKLRLLDDIFTRRLSNEKTGDPKISAALNTIWCCKGQVRIQKLARGLDISRRSLERQFLDNVGLTPKRVCRITRFLGVFFSLSRIQNPDWAELAISSGYSDQAHLIRECKYFTGHSPRAYLKNRSALEHAVMGTADTLSHFFNTTDVLSDTMRLK